MKNNDLELFDTREERRPRGSSCATLRTVGGWLFTVLSVLGIILAIIAITLAALIYTGNTQAAAAVQTLISAATAEVLLKVAPERRASLLVNILTGAPVAVSVALGDVTGLLQYVQVEGTLSLAMAGGAFQYSVTAPVALPPALVPSGTLRASLWIMAYNATANRLVHAAGSPVALCNSTFPVACQGTGSAEASGTVYALAVYDKNTAAPLWVGLLE